MPETIGFDNPPILSHFTKHHQLYRIGNIALAKALQDYVSEGLAGGGLPQQLFSLSTPDATTTLF